MIMERKIVGIIKHCTITKTSTGKYFVSILTEQEYSPMNKTGLSVGIDLGYRKNISDGTSDYGCGDQIRPEKSGTICESSKEMKHTASETII